MDPTINYRIYGKRPVVNVPILVSEFVFGTYGQINVIT